MSPAARRFVGLAYAALARSCALQRDANTTQYREREISRETWAERNAEIAIKAWHYKQSARKHGVRRYP
jgi:hypothetical protein